MLLPRIKRKSRPTDTAANNFPNKFYNKKLFMLSEKFGTHEEFIFSYYMERTAVVIMPEAYLLCRQR